MSVERLDYVISDIGVIAILERSLKGGWETRGGGYIRDEDLVAHWRILDGESRRAIYRTHGIKIDPPKPRTERVHWSKLIKPGSEPNRMLEEGKRVLAIKVWSDGSATISAAEGKSYATNQDGMVEVLVGD